jgi:hypothetical protein
MREKRKLNDSNEAVVGIVVTVLLVGLVLSVTVMINNVYVPQWVEQEEVAHMDQVSQQFSQLKYAIDMQCMIDDATTISTAITLGNREIPFFNAGRTFGALTISPDSCVFTINWSQGGPVNTKSYVSDSIRYSSGNSYYVNQDYIYQGGALILDQDNTDVLLGKPSIIVYRDGDQTTGKKVILFNIIDISAVDEKSSGGGFGTYEIFTQVTNPSSTNSMVCTNVSNIAIETAYPHAWNTSLKRSFHQSNLTINYTATIKPNKLEISFDQDKEGYYYDIVFKITEVKTEIGFGISNI